MMNRATQRLIFLILFFGVAIVLYRSLGSQENAVQHGGVGSYGNAGLALKDLEPANSTLGVSSVTATYAE